MAKATREKSKPVYKAKSSFRDRNDFTKEYKQGDDVSHLDSSILESLLERELIELEGTEPQSEAQEDGSNAGTNAGPDKK